MSLSRDLRNALRRWRADRALDTAVEVVLVLFAATLATGAIDSYIGDNTTYTFYIGAIILIGLRYGGIALVTSALLAALTYSYFFAEPKYSLQVNKPEVVFGLITFSAIAIVTAILARRIRDTGGDLHRTRDELERQTRELRESLERERQLKGLQERFISTICHEFRTPLTIIDMTAQNQRMIGGPDADSYPAWASVREEVKRAGDLLSQIQTSQALGSYRHTARPSSFTLRTVIEELCDVQASISPHHEIQRSLAGLSGEMVADPFLIRRLFSNLLANAVKYSPAADRIWVEGYTNNGIAEIIVADWGIGIPEAERAMVFESFYRAANTGNIPGTGIGLSLCREIALLHGGSITLSDNDPQGTKVKVRLPVTE